MTILSLAKFRRLGLTTYQFLQSDSVPHSTTNYWDKRIKNIRDEHLCLLSEHIELIKSYPDLTLPKGVNSFIPVIRVAWLRFKVLNI